MVIDLASSTKIPQQAHYNQIARNHSQFQWKILEDKLNHEHQTSFSFNCINDNRTAALSVIDNQQLHVSFNKEQEYNFR